MRCIGWHRANHRGKTSCLASYEVFRCVKYSTSRNSNTSTTARSTITLPPQLPSVLLPKRGEIGKASPLPAELWSLWLHSTCQGIGQGRRLAARPYRFRCSTQRCSLQYDGGTASRMKVEWTFTLACNPPFKPLCRAAATMWF